MKERTIDFTTVDGFKLNGTLCVPDGQVRGVALIVSGSGPTDRDGNSSVRVPGADFFGAINLQRELAAHFAARGIVTLRYDKRACAGYTAQHEARAWDADMFSFVNTVDDADQAATVLMAQPEAAGHGLAIAGHSEGGLVAMMVAQRRKTETLYLLATCGRTLRAVLRGQFYDRYFTATGDAAAAELFAGQASDAMQAITVGAPLPSDMPRSLTGVFNDMTRPFYRDILDIDPQAIAGTLACDVLVVNGTSDIQVNHQADAEPLFAAFARRAAAGRQNLVKIPGASHVFKMPADPLDVEGAFKGPVTPALFSAIDSFMRKPKPGPR